MARKRRIFGAAFKAKVALAAARGDRTTAELHRKHAFRRTPAVDSLPAQKPRRLLIAKQSAASPTTERKPKAPTSVGK